MKREFPGEYVKTFKFFYFERVRQRKRGTYRDRESEREGRRKERKKEKEKERERHIAREWKRVKAFRPVFFNLFWFAAPFWS